MKNFLRGLALFTGMMMFGTLAHAGLAPQVVTGNVGLGGAIGIGGTPCPGGTGGNQCYLVVTLRNFKGTVPKVINSTLFGPVKSTVIPTSTGSFSFYIWPNDEVVPMTCNPGGNSPCTFYEVDFFYAGAQVSSANWQFVGPGPYNLNSLAPMPSTANPPPPFLPILSNPVGDQVVYGTFGLSVDHLVARNYVDFTFVQQPTLPPATICRLYADQPSGKLVGLNSTGGSCLPSSGGGGGGSGPILQVNGTNLLSCSGGSCSFGNWVDEVNFPNIHFTNTTLGNITAHVMGDVDALQSIGESTFVDSGVVNNLTACRNAGLLQTQGIMIPLNPANGNTGASTFALCSNSPQPILKSTTVGYVGLDPGDIVPSNIANLVSIGGVGTSWLLLNPLSNVGVNQFTEANCTNCTFPTVQFQLAYFNTGDNSANPPNVIGFQNSSRATSQNPFVQSYIVTRGAGSTGTATLAGPGTITKCVMDVTLPLAPPSWAGTPVGVSPTDLGRCTPLINGVPSGYWVLGTLLDLSTVAESASNVLVQNYFAVGNTFVSYGISGAYLVNQGTNGRNDAIQTFPCDQFFCTLVVGSYGTPPCCSQPDGSIGLAPPGLSSGVPHVTYSAGGIWYTNLTSNDSVCDLFNGCAGTGAAVLQSGAPIFSPSLWNPVTNNLTINSVDGNFADIQDGTGSIIAGTVSSGTFIGPVNNTLGEPIKQTTTNATSTFTLVEPSGAIVVTTVTGSPDNSHTWVGQLSGAIFTPTAVPSTTVFVQYQPTFGHDYIGYGPDGMLQLSNNGDAFSRIARGGDSPTGPSGSNFVNGTSTPATVLTSATIPKNSFRNFDCIGVYSFSGGVGQAIFTITPTQTPQSIIFWGGIVTNTTAGSINYPTAVTSPGPGTVIQSSVNANAGATNYHFEVHGVIRQNASNAGTFALQAAASANTINIAQNSAYCRMN